MIINANDIWAGDKRVANIYLGQDPVPVYTSGEPDPVLEWEMGINLTRVDNPTPDTVPNWNNLRPAHETIPDGTFFDNLVDVNNVNREVTLTVGSGEADSAEWYEDGDTPPDYPHPNCYWASWFQYDDATSTFTISGLDDSKRYFLRFLSGDDQNYSEGDLITRITIGSDSVDLDATLGVPSSTDFDDPAYASFDEVAPVSGVITFSVSRQGTENYWMMEAIRIREYTMPTPPDPPQDGQVILSIIVTGLPDADVLLNGESQPNNQMLFPAGTQVNDIIPEADGYEFTPPSQSVLMNENKSISFAATPE